MHYLEIKLLFWWTGPQAALLFGSIYLLLFVWVSKFSHKQKALRNYVLIALDLGCEQLKYVLDLKQDYSAQFYYVSKWQIKRGKGWLQVSDM